MVKALYSLLSSVVLLLKMHLCMFQLFSSVLMGFSWFWCVHFYSFSCFHLYSWIMLYFPCPFSHFVPWQFYFCYLFWFLKCPANLGNLYTHHPLILKIQCFLYDLHAHLKFVSFSWIPSNLGLSGKEKFDVLAKRTVHFPPANHYALLFHDYVPPICHSGGVSWHPRWDQYVADCNKLVQLKPFLGSWSSCSLYN